MLFIVLKLINYKYIIFITVFTDNYIKIIVSKYYRMINQRLHTQNLRPVLLVEGFQAIFGKSCFYKSVNYIKLPI